MPKVLAGSVAEHRREMLSRVYRSFGELIYERGYDALTLAEIAKAAGMSRTAMYNYFPDKESLLLAYTSHEMDEFFSDLRTELYRLDDPIDQLRAYVRAHLAYFASHHVPPGPGLRSILSENGYGAMRRHAATLEVALSAILSEAVADGRIPESVLDDGQTIPLINACLSSGQVRDLAGDELEDAIAGVERFVLRAVGVDLVN